MQTCFPCSAEKDNCSFLISNSSFPQGYVNPPIRGSIVGLRRQEDAEYRGINPHIRGSIDNNKEGNKVKESVYVSIPL